MNSAVCGLTKILLKSFAFSSFLQRNIVENDYFSFHCFNIKCSNFLTMHEETFELFACRWLWQRKLLFQVGKGSCHLVLRSNNSHTLCFQGPGSTAVRSSAESLVLLPSCLVRRQFQSGCALHVPWVPVPARLWASCCLRGWSLSQAEENPLED